MGIVFDRRLAIPLWAVAACAVALNTTGAGAPSVTTPLGIAILASILPAVRRWWRRRRQLVEVLPAADEHAAPVDTLRTDAGTHMNARQWIDLPTRESVGSVPSSVRRQSAE